jgi:hypothetical protein
MLIAGCYDNMESWATMQKSQAYADRPENLTILNHATGHRPPPEALHAGYAFLERLCSLYIIPGYQIAAAPFGENGYFNSSEPKVKSCCLTDS